MPDLVLVDPGRTARGPVQSGGTCHDGICASCQFPLGHYAIQGQAPSPDFVLKGDVAAIAGEWAPEPPVLVARTRRGKAGQIARDQLRQAVRVSVLSAGELLKGCGDTVAATDCHLVSAVPAMTAD